MVASKPDELREKALRYRAMIVLVSDQRLVDALNSLAEEYEALAERAENLQTGTSPTQ
jgi:uncharacterized protein with von Willebrand factor type A (vWA) domain